MRSERYSIPAIYHVLVRLKTDEGLEGLGYGLVLDRRHAKPLATLLVELEDLIIGQDPTFPEAIWKAASDAVYLAGPAGLAMMAVSAIDIAVWDLFGKIVGQPLYKLLGGARTEVPAYFTGALAGPSDEAVAEQAQEHVANGLTAMKIGLTGGQPQAIVRRVAAIRKAVGPDIKLLLDNVESWSPTEAIQLGRMLEEFKLYWFEDPVQHLDYRGLAQVSAALDTPVCAGEYLYGLDGFRPLLEGACVDVVMIDVRRAGGVTPYRKIAAAAETWRLPTVPHFMPEVTAHLVAASKSSLIAEVVNWSFPLFENPVRIEKGVIRLPSQPGLGLALRTDAVEQFRV